MNASSIARALQRVRDTFMRKPGLASFQDEPARATLVAGAKARLEMPGGGVLFTDLAPVLGGNGDGVQPGWLMRAGLASCLASSIALRAAEAGISLDRLEVLAESESDARGLFEWEPPVPAGPLHVRLSVDIAASGVDAHVLRGLVERADAHSPVSDALRRRVEMRLQVRTG